MDGRRGEISTCEREIGTIMRRLAAVPSADTDPKKIVDCGVSARIPERLRVLLEADPGR